MAADDSQPPDTSLDRTRSVFPNLNDRGWMKYRARSFLSPALSLDYSLPVLAPTSKSSRVSFYFHFAHTELGCLVHECLRSILVFYD